MKEDRPKEFLLAEQLRASPKKRRREHAPKANFATWLVIAWLAFMAAWGCKHFYRQWVESSNSTDVAAGVIMPVEPAINATAEPAGAVTVPGSTDSCPLK